MEKIGSIPNVTQNLVARMRESSRESPIVNRLILEILTDLRSTIPGALTRPGDQVLSHVGYRPIIYSVLIGWSRRLPFKAFQ